MYYAKNREITRLLKTAAPVRVVAVDALPVTLKGIEKILMGEPGFELVAACTTEAEALEIINSQQFDILLLDVHLPNKGALHILGHLFELKQPIKTVVFAQPNTDSNLISKVIQQGVRGILLKTMDTSMMLQCLTRVHNGGKWLDIKQVQSALERIIYRQIELEKLGAELTQRELDVAFLVAKGCSNRTIAEKLNITEGSIKNRLHRIFTKLDLPNRLALTLSLQSRDLV